VATQKKAGKKLYNKHDGGRFSSFEPMVWVCGTALAICLGAIGSLMLLLGYEAFGNFWPTTVKQFQVSDAGSQRVILGQVVRETRHSAIEAADSSRPWMDRLLVKQGNRDLYTNDYVWVDRDKITKIGQPEAALVLERSDWGHFYGFPSSIVFNGRQLVIDTESSDLWSALERIVAEHGALAKPDVSDDVYQLVIRLVDGRPVTLDLSTVTRAYQPNAMSWSQKIVLFAKKVTDFLSSGPREGGVYPAIVGTVTMVLLMSVAVMPFGVVAAVYLHEYAQQGPFTRIVRIAVNNLAGVPSIVYGIFGLGFFVYSVGGRIDGWLFADQLPRPTFGTPGLLWASLTLALLTLPVVIVATEEGLTRIPRSFREGSMALGATPAETLWRVVLPMASPAIMTGLILAVARAAGEVAPLMLVGAVKLAPALPIDGNFPYLHLDQQFMHLGYSIYELGLQSPSIEASRPMVFATALLLVLLIATLNISAIILRNRLRERYRALQK